MSDHEERAEDGRRERAEDRADRRGVPVCEICLGKGGFEWSSRWEQAECPGCGAMPAAETKPPIACPDYRGSGYLENREGTISEFCIHCQQPGGYHR